MSITLILIVQNFIRAVNLPDECANRVAILETYGISQCERRGGAELTSHSFHEPSCTHTFCSFMTTVQLLLYGMRVSYSIPFIKNERTLCLSRRRRRHFLAVA